MVQLIVCNCFRYDICKNKWKKFNKFISCRYGHGALIFRNHLLMIGGKNNVLLASDAVHKLNLNASSSLWHNTKNLIRPRVGLAAVILKLY